MYLSVFRKQRQKIAIYITFVLLLCISINCLLSSFSTSHVTQAAHHTSNSFDVRDSKLINYLDILATSQSNQLPTSTVSKHCAESPQCDIQNSLTALFTIIISCLFSILLYLNLYLSPFRKQLSLHLDKLIQWFYARMNFPRQHLVFCVQLN